MLHSISKFLIIEKQISISQHPTINTQTRSHSKKKTINHFDFDLPIPIHLSHHPHIVFFHSRFPINTRTGGYKKALDDALKFMSQFSITVDAKDDKQFKKLLHATIGTKFINRWFEQFSSIAIDAVRTIAATDKAGRTSVDIKRFLRVEKVKQLLQIFILFFFSRRKDHIFCIYIFSFLQLINNFNTPKKKKSRSRSPAEISRSVVSSKVQS